MAAHRLGCVYHGNCDRALLYGLAAHRNRTNGGSSIGQEFVGRRRFFRRAPVLGNAVGEC